MASSQSRLRTIGYLALAGCVLVAATMASVGAWWAALLWLLVGWAARSLLSGGRPHWYSLCIALFFPLMIGAGFLAAFLGTRWGFPLTGAWVSDASLCFAFACFVAAESLALARGARRPHGRTL